MNYRPKRATGRPGEDTDSLFLSCKASAFLAGRLVEPGADVGLPIFMEVAIGDDIVVLHSADLSSTATQR